jgi:N-acyl-D-amino-acid deacylase
MAEFDVMIKNGTIIDGTRVPRYRADLGIKNGKIAKIGRLNTSDAARVIDATGLIVAPGAIDLHTHYDAQIHWDPYCTTGSWHGITSVTLGNCGFGFAPLHAKDAERAMLALSRNEAIPLEPMRVSIKVDWETFPQYMDRLAHMPLGVNLSQLFPISPVVAYVMGGFDDAKKRFPNDKEMGEILQHFHGGMAAGAVGWSTQRLISRGALQRDYDGTPMISDILPDEFYLTMARALGEHDGGFIQITQSTVEGNQTAFGVPRDIDFSARLSEESGCSVLFNAIAVNDRFPEVHQAQLRQIADINAKGIRLFGQGLTTRLPARLTLEDWNLFDDSEAWREATVGTVEERKAKLSNPKIRQALREDYNNPKSSDFFFGELPRYIARKVRQQDLKAKYEGLSLEQIAQQENKHVIDAMLDLSVADNLRTEWAGPVTNANVQNFKALMDSPYLLPGVSDGGAHVKFITPSIYPTEVLAWMARDAGILSLEEAHFRLSSLMAWAACFKDRGTLREGLAADIIVYDLAKLQSLPDEIAYDLPVGEWRRVQRAEGYRWIMVNGETIFEDGKCTGATPGKLLRHGQAV